MVVFGGRLGEEANLPLGRDVGERGALSLRLALVSRGREGAVPQDPSLTTEWGREGAILPLGLSLSKRKREGSKLALSLPLIGNRRGAVLALEDVSANDGERTIMMDQASRYLLLDEVSQFPPKGIGSAEA